MYILRYITYTKYTVKTISVATSPCGLPVSRRLGLDLGRSLAYVSSLFAGKFKET